MCLSFFLVGVSAHAQDWGQVIKAVSADRSSSDQFGGAVAISGDYAIVGAIEADEDTAGNNFQTGAGAAYILKNTNGSWTQVQKLVASDRAAGDLFGIAVSIDGDYAVVGSIFDDEDANGGDTKSAAGSAYIFKNISGTWTQVSKIVASDRAEGDEFGSTVSISGDYVIVGAAGSDPLGSGSTTIADAGSAYIFKNNAGTWSQVSILVATDRAMGDNFGRKVGISGDYAIVGTIRESEDASGANTKPNAGSAYIFKNTSGTWSQMQKIVASDRSNDDQFGCSVAISGDYAVIGAFAEDEDASGGDFNNYAGSAYTFKRDGSSWTQQQKLVPSDRDEEDQFGWSVAISGDYIIVGANKEGHDVSGGSYLYNSGSAYAFKREGNSWTQQQKLVASDRTDMDDFGNSVAISGAYSIVGARYQESDASGSNFKGDAGAIYIFKNSASFVADDFKPLSLKGFNEDLIAEGTGGSASAVTTTSFDIPTAQDFVFNTKEFRYGSTGGKYGLPNDGVIESASNTGVKYQLADYTSNNSLLLTADDEGELVLEEPGVFAQLAILSSSSNGSSSFTVTVTYSDGSTEDEDFTVADWFFGNNPAIKGIGRINRTTGIYEPDDDENPRLYDTRLLVDSNKVVSKLKFKKTNSGSRTGIFAVCGLTAVGVPDAPVAKEATNIVQQTSFTANWDAVAEATSYRLDVASDSNYTMMLAGYNNLDVSNVTSYNVLSAEGTLFYQVRAFNTKGQSVNSNTIVVNAGTTGISKGLQQTIQVYPNPTRGELTINTTKKVESVEIQDVMGRRIMGCDVSGQNKTINITNLKPGVYILNTMIEGKLISTNIIKN